MELKSLSYSWEENEGFESFMYNFKPRGIDKVKDLIGLHNCLNETSEQLKNIANDIWNLPFKMSRDIDIAGILNVNYVLIRNYKYSEFKAVVITPKIDLNNNRKPKVCVNVWDNKYQDKMLGFHDKIISNPEFVYSDNVREKLKQIELLRGNTPTIDLIKKLSE